MAATPWGTDLHGAVLRAAGGRAPHRGVAAVAALALVLAGCSLPDDGPGTSVDNGPSADATSAPGTGPGGPAGQDRSPLFDTPADSAAVYEVYGDSLTVADSPDFAGGRLGPESWLAHMDPERFAVTAAGGRWGATVPDVLAGHLADGPMEADALLVFLGTNDLFRAAGDTASAHAAFVGEVEDLAGRRGRGGAAVVVVAVGPSGTDAARGVPGPVRDWNERTRAAAAERGWTFVDPWGPVRDEASNTFADPQDTTDGLHLSVSGAQKLAEGMELALADGPDA